MNQNNATLALAQDPGIWQIEISSGSGPLISHTRNVPLKWASDARTGQPRYIHEPQVVDKSAACQCPACNLPLTPVLAGKPLHKNPCAFFRHPPGFQKAHCTVVTARLAAVQHLLERGFIDLPRRRMSATAVGFSGQGYEGWAERAAERISIASAMLHDQTTALLTLDDGRELFVDLIGSGALSSDGQGRAIVTVSLSDPALAMMSLDDIRARLRLLPPITWCSHWEDQWLHAAAVADAQQTAREALDAWSAEEEAQFAQSLPGDSDASVAQRRRRETLLHREVKNILEKGSEISVPGFLVQALRRPPDELIDDWEEQTIRLRWQTGETTLSLKKTQLERKLGSIVPDVICALSEPRPFIFGTTETWLDDSFEELLEDTDSSQRWPPTLLIEVTVTHGIDEEKLRRVQALDIPALEIDIGSLGGRLSLDGLRELVLNNTIGKRWIHHPFIEFIHENLEMELDRHPLTIRLQERLADLRLHELRARPTEEWASIYLAAATEYFDANVAVDKARRAHTGAGQKPAYLGKDSECWQTLSEAAQGLAAHGYPGAAEAEMMNEAGIVSRLLSIQHNRGIGYAFDTGYQVLDSIMGSGRRYQQWQTLYAMAVKNYGLEARFTLSQAKRYTAWRTNIIQKVKAGDATYFRPAVYDAVLSLLFPEMAVSLAQGYGRQP